MERASLASLRAEVARAAWTGARTSSPTSARARAIRIALERASQRHAVRGRAPPERDLRRARRGGARDAAPGARAVCVCVWAASSAPDTSSRAAAWVCGGGEGFSRRGRAATAGGRRRAVSRRGPRDLAGGRVSRRERLTGRARASPPPPAPPRALFDTQDRAMTGNRRRDDLLNGNNDYSSKSDSAAGATGGLFGDANNPPTAGSACRTARARAAATARRPAASATRARRARTARRRAYKPAADRRRAPAAGARPRYGGLPGGGGGGGGHGGGMGGHHAPGAAPLGAGPGRRGRAVRTRTGTRAR